MSVLNKLAGSLGRNDDVPNQVLAKSLAQSESIQDIEEIVEGFRNAKSSVQSDCLKVLYEIGYLKPRLIEKYVDDFLEGIGSRNNRIVWGSMIALSTIGRAQAKKIYGRIEEVYAALGKGSVITVDNGIKLLAAVAAAAPAYGRSLLPYLLKHLQTCRPKEIPQHAESIAPAVSQGTLPSFLNAIRKREGELSPAQLARVGKLQKAVRAKWGP